MDQDKAQNCAEFAKHIAIAHENEITSYWLLADEAKELLKGDGEAQRFMLDHLEQQYGVTRSLRWVQKAIRMALAFPEKDRILPYSLRLFEECLAWKPEAPVDALAEALDRGWSGVNVRNFRLTGDPEGIGGVDGGKVCAHCGRPESAKYRICGVCLEAICKVVGGKDVGQE